MNTMNTMIKATCALALTSLFATQANAVTLDITANFRPDPSNPARNEFVNTTPPGGYCGDHPSYCENGVFSVGLPIRFKSTGPIAALHDERKGPMFRVPSSWRDITVIHEDTGASETVRMRVNGIGAAYTISKPLPVGVWDASWVNAPAPCLVGALAMAMPTITLFSGECRRTRVRAPNKRK